MTQEKDRIFTLKNFDIVKIEHNADHTADITILDKDTNECLTFTRCYIQDVQMPGAVSLETSNETVTITYNGK